MTTDKHPEGNSDEDVDGLPTKREAQQPLGSVAGDDTWLSGEDEHDPQREEAAERARRAVEPRRPRE
jgi:hypothetical protein